jgi:cobyrinic acid a,c-diamide synthase
MVLGSGLVDSEGIGHPMLGFLQLETSFEKRQLHLGYRMLEAEREFFAGQSIYAHEFHYTSAIRQIGDPLFSVSDALGNSLGYHGLHDGNVLGSYMHLINAGEQ